MTIEEIAAEAKRPRGWFYKQRMVGEFPPMVRLGGKLLIRRSEWEAWIEAHREPAAISP